MDQELLTGANVQRVAENLFGGERGYREGGRYLQFLALEGGTLEAKKAVELSKGVPDTIAFLAYAEALNGKKADALSILNGFQSSHGFLPPEAAFAYARLGDKEEGFSCP